MQKNLVKDSHEVIDMWKTILDDPLGINGLIFSYTDLGLLFSDYNLNLLAIKEKLNKQSNLDIKLAFICIGFIYLDIY